MALTDKATIASVDVLGRISPAFEEGYIKGYNDCIINVTEWLADNIKESNIVLNHHSAYLTADDFIEALNHDLTC